MKRSEMTAEQLQHVRSRDLKLRRNMTPEQRELARVRDPKLRRNMTPKQREIVRAPHLKTNVTPEKRAVDRRMRANMSEDERQHARATDPHLRANMSEDQRQHARASDPHLRANMSEEQRQQRRANERSKERARERLRQEIEEVGGEVNYDAKKFTDALRNTTQFLMCAVCAYEGPKSEMIDREKLEVALECSGIYEKYNEWIDNLEHGCKYDRAYCNAVVDEMENGLLKDVTTICNKCADHLTGTRIKRTTVWTIHLMYLHTH
jgi:hypothetical protein